MAAAEQRHDLSVAEAHPVKDLPPQSPVPRETTANHSRASGRRNDFIADVAAQLLPARRPKRADTRRAEQRCERRLFTAPRHTRRLGRVRDELSDYLSNSAGHACPPRRQSRTRRTSRRQAACRALPAASGCTSRQRAARARPPSRPGRAERQSTALLFTRRAVNGASSRLLFTARAGAPVCSMPTYAARTHKSL